MPLVGRSPAMQEIYRSLARLMQTDLTVMINGESGTGKELVARALHDYGKRKKGPFVAINMAAIPRDLIESELFGHEKGAFTGANQRSAGRFEQAEGGTLFLDEIGDMPMEAQTRLLRVLQQGEYTTVGGRTPIKTNVRIIAATNKDLRTLIQQGLFREDLYFRLNVVPLAAAAAARAHRRHPRPRASFLQGRGERRPAAEIYRAGGARPDEEISLAGQHPRTGKSHPPARRAASAGSHLRRNWSRPNSNMKCGRLTPGDSGCAAAAPSQELSIGQTLSTSVEQHLAKLFRDHGDQLPPPGLYHRIIREIEIPLDFRGACGDARQSDQGGGIARAEPQHAAQESQRSRHPPDAFAAIATLPGRSIATGAGGAYTGAWP